MASHLNHTCFPSFPTLLLFLFTSDASPLFSCKKDDLRRIAKACGGKLMLTLADLEGQESFDASNLGEAELVGQENVGDNELIVVRGCKEAKAASFILRGPNSYVLDEMDRSVHDSLCAVKRVLESGNVVPGGGAVEVALSMYLENFARTLGSREQLAIAEFASALLVIPKTLAVNAALDATDLTAKLCTLHRAAQENAEKKSYAYYGLDLFEGKPRDNIAAGVLEPAMGKVKCIQFATEAAMSILRIDDLIKLNPKADPKGAHEHEDDYE
jgi:T-complex protein 1 subunit alpha